MQRELSLARSSGEKVIKFVHGYGSTGEGGEIRIAVQKELIQQLTSGRLTSVIFGEDWRISNENTWELLKKMPELKTDSDLGRANKGITIVVL
jgi:adenine specific DNA methylase Mod